MLKKINAKNIMFGLVFVLVVPMFINLTDHTIEHFVFNTQFNFNSILPTFGDIFYVSILVLLFIVTYSRMRKFHTSSTPNNITKYREELGLSTSEFAQLCGITSQSLSVIECGKHSPSLEMANIIAEKLNKNINEVFFQRGENNEK